MHDVQYILDAEVIEKDNRNLLRQYWGELKMMLGSYNMPTWETFVSIVGKVKRSLMCSQNLNDSITFLELN